MNGKIIFTSAKPNVNNKQLEKDSAGYYYITLGALNVFNSAGQFYTATGVKDMFEDKASTLMRRLKSAFLKSEVGHPKRLPGMSKNEFFNRNLRIEETNVCAHIRDLELVETNDDSGLGDGSTVILVKGWIKPSGPKGDFLQKALDNPDENVAFSVRSFTQNSVVHGTMIKQIVQLVTYDFVTEPGISYATKNKTLGLESMDTFEMDLSEVTDGDDIDECFACSLENEDEKQVVKELLVNVRKCEQEGNCILEDW